MILIISSFSAINTMQVGHSKNQQDIATLTNNYSIVSATFNSPEVIIKTTSIDEFLQKAQQVNATVIYETTAEGYVVVDNEFTYAYNLRLPIAFMSSLESVGILVGVLLLFASAMAWFMRYEC